MMTATQIAECRKIAPAFVSFEPYIAKIETDFHVDTVDRMAAFLAQCAHESALFKRTVENLNYSEAGLQATFKTHFSASECAAYAHRPEMIANRAYANRGGNRDEASGDGWAFRGRGLIQVTGRDNYHACSIALYGDDRLLRQSELLEQPEGAVRSAAWFWQSHGLNELADRASAASFCAMTKKINGGYSELDKRQALWEQFKKALKTG